jgi:predicted alpha/beta-hydrolase family hydrolase
VKPQHSVGRQICCSNTAYKRKFTMDASTHSAGLDDAPGPVVSVAPVVLPAPGRAVDLEVRISAPVTGSRMPIILLSHGHGAGLQNNLSSFNGYGPIVNYWAARGFVVIQPSHLDASTLSENPNLTPKDPEAPLYWRSRAVDMTRILDSLDVIEAAVPPLAGRLDRDRVAVAGHSMGGHTASLLLGMRVTDPADGTVVSLAEPRIKAGVVMAGPGRGGDAVTKFIAEHYPVLLTPDFSTMTTPALVVGGDKDVNPMFTPLGAQWRVDAYYLSPGPKSLLTVFGGEHMLGGIVGYDAKLTTDENPERAAAVARLSWAYLHSELYPGDSAWKEAQQELTTGADAFGQVESK